MNSTVFVTRPLFKLNPSPTGRLRIDIDGALVARLYPGGTVRVDVPAGRHLVVARKDWTRAAPLEVNLDPGEEIDVFAWIPWGVYLAAYCTPKHALRCLLGSDLKDKSWARRGRPVKPRVTFVTSPGP